MTALDGVDLRVDEGEAHALVGENGAGKSTLVRILCGLSAPDAGEVIVRGTRLRPGDPRAALGRGIAIVQQHFALADPLTVAENVVLGAEPRRGPFLDWGRAVREVRALIDRMGVHLNPNDRVEGLTVGQRQAVEIMKALHRKVRCLVLDEPTAALSPAEASRLFEALHRLRVEGLTLLLVTHRLREVIAHTDRATILRQGRVAGHFETAAASEAELALAVIGSGTVPKVPSSVWAVPGAVLVEVKDLAATDARGVQVLGGLSLTVRAGEIVGVAGVSGNGQAELARALAGRLPGATGEALFQGCNILRQSPSAIRRLGLASIPEDRDREGMVLPFSLAENAILGNHRDPGLMKRSPPPRSLRAFARFLPRLGFGRFSLLDGEAVRARANRLIHRFGVRARGVDAPAFGLSGGNRQKLLVGRELGANPRMVVAAQPARGLDIRSAAAVHGELVCARNRGAGVLLISQDLEEILRIADRILVMVGGRIVADLPRAEVDEERLGRWMTGMKG